MSYTPPLDGFKPSLFSKIAEVQGEMHSMRPDETVTTDSYTFTYISESQLLEAVRAQLSTREGAAVVSVDSQHTDMVEAQKTRRDGGTYTVQYAASEITLRIVFADGESGETFTIFGQGRANDAGDKSVYKAITSANRYAWWKTMLVPTGDDDVNKDSGGVGELAGSGAAPAASGEPEPPPNSSPFTPPAPREQPTDGGDPFQVVVTFGTHKGKTLGQVQAEKESWLHWLISDKYEAKTAETRRIVGAAKLILGMAVPVPATDPATDDFAPPHDDSDVPFQ